MLFATRFDEHGGVCAMYALAPWAEEEVFADEFLQGLGRPPTPWVAVGDGIVTFTLTNGSASYGLRGYELLRNVHHGVLGAGATWEAPP